MGQPAARITDPAIHTHGEGAVMNGCPTVLIGKLPAARQGDLIRHNTGTEAIVEGESTVLIAGQQAARMGDKIGCGGVLLSGDETVWIGLTPQGSCLKAASDEGAAFVQAVE